MLSRLFLSSLRMSRKSFTPRMRWKVCISVTENSSAGAVCSQATKLCGKLCILQLLKQQKMDSADSQLGADLRTNVHNVRGSPALVCFSARTVPIHSCAFTLNRVLKCIINSFRNAFALSIVLIPKYRKIYGKRPCKVCVGRQRNECERCNSLSVLLKFSCCKLAVNLVYFLL